MSEEKAPVSITESDGVKIVEFTDRKILEELSISEIGDTLAGLINAHPGIKLLLCFKGVDHLSSAALGVLITLNKRVQEQNGVLKLSNITPQIYEVFKITRLNKLFDIRETMEDALRSF
ncbi:MAG: STAS domain-containing protein [Planctomycetes bacterium]|nr:STAS domain-containing protein [Planctomycetota bacterium]